jgi:hypothetical protein
MTVVTGLPFRRFVGMVVLVCILLISLQPIADVNLISHCPTEIWQQSTQEEQFMNSTMLETSDRTTHIVHRKFV